MLINLYIQLINFGCNIITNIKIFIIIIAHHFKEIYSLLKLKHFNYKSEFKINAYTT